MIKTKKMRMKKKRMLITTNWKRSLWPEKNQTQISCLENTVTSFVSVLHQFSRMDWWFQVVGMTTCNSINSNFPYKCQQSKNSNNLRKWNKNKLKRFHCLCQLWLSHSRSYLITKLSILLTFLLIWKTFSRWLKKSWTVQMSRLFKVKNFKSIHQLSSHAINRVVYLQLQMHSTLKSSTSKGLNFMTAFVLMKKSICWNGP